MSRRFITKTAVAGDFQKIPSLINGGPRSAPGGFPNCALAREAWRRMRRELLLEQWKREELRRTPFAVFDRPPSYEELAARFKVSYRRRSSGR
jgi:hypothetical protein